MLSSPPEIILPPRTLLDFIKATNYYLQTQPTTPSIVEAKPPSTSSVTLVQDTPPVSRTTTFSPDQSNQDTMHSSHRNRVVETRTTKPTLMTRLRGRNANTRTVKTTTKIEPASAHHATHATHTHNTRTARHSGWGGNRRVAGTQRRKVSMGDRLSGAMMKLRGSLTRRPGLKAAGARRMHGTDGRGTHRVY
ncbi:hypothetical protein BGZ60DRAFT_523224 [Tricladium varicosporioides]|nr:hypothetical protein BGZ60DRAFT_523224 [Hymenoscyphus varicosporioides]